MKKHKKKRAARSTKSDRAVMQSFLLFPLRGGRSPFMVEPYDSLPLLQIHNLLLRRHGAEGLQQVILRIAVDFSRMDPQKVVGGNVEILRDPFQRAEIRLTRPLHISAHSGDCDTQIACQFLLCDPPFLDQCAKYLAKGHTVASCLT